MARGKQKEKKVPSLEEFAKGAPPGTPEAEIKEEYEKRVAALEDAEIKEPTGDEGLSYPPNPRKDSTTKMLRGKWRDQKRIKCADPKCCYPLNVIVIKGERTKIEVPEGHEAEGEVAYKAECSWDPRHTRPEDESPQYVTHKQLYPPEDPGEEDV